MLNTNLQFYKTIKKHNQNVLLVKHVYWLYCKSILIRNIFVYEYTLMRSEHSELIAWTTIISNLSYAAFEYGTSVCLWQEMSLITASPFLCILFPLILYVRKNSIALLLCNKFCSPICPLAHSFSRLCTHLPACTLICPLAHSLTRSRALWSIIEKNTDKIAIW